MDICELDNLDNPVPEFSDSEIREMCSEIERNGYACVPDFVSPEKLKRMQDFVTSAVESSGNEYVLFKGSDAVAGTGLDELAQSPAFQSIFSRLYAASLSRPAPPVAFYQILRCLTGKGMGEHSLRFHFDSYLITALVPIEIPAEGRRGDLLVLPNARKLHRTYIANLIDKLALENRFTQRLLHWVSRRGRLQLTRISMVPGNLYLFWGYRSIHANEPCDPSKVRATALYHYADPHANSILKTRLRRRQIPA